MNEDVFSKALGLLPEIRADILRRVPVELQMFIGLEMHKTKLTKDKKISKEKNTTNILFVRSGNLFRSFTKGNPFNILKDTGKGIEFGSKLPYAAIHEYGGVIDHPGTSNGFGKGIPIPAHGIPMPKRSYLAPAIKAFEEQALEALVIKSMQPIRELFK
jgi:phage gpG-like protein